MQHQLRPLCLPPQRRWPFWISLFIAALLQPVPPSGALFHLTFFSPVRPSKATNAGSEKGTGRREFSIPNPIRSWLALKPLNLGFICRGPKKSSTSAFCMSVTVNIHVYDVKGIQQGCEKKVQEEYKVQESKKSERVRKQRNKGGREEAKKARSSEGKEVVRHFPSSHRLLNSHTAALCGYARGKCPLWAHLVLLFHNEAFLLGCPLRHKSFGHSASVAARLKV